MKYESKHEVIYWNSRSYLKKGRYNLVIDADCKIKCLVPKNYGPVRKNYGPVPTNYGPVRKLCGPVLISYGPVRNNYGPVRKNNGPVRKNYGPVRKNHEMRNFAYKNTYNEGPLWTFDQKNKNLC